LLNQICSSILRINKQIKFVSVVNNNGKLLVGRSRSTDNKCIHGCYGLGGHIFYLEFLNFAINNFKRGLEIAINKRSSIDNHDDKGLYFEITGSNNDAMLAVTTINKAQEKFLCEYFEPAAHDKVQTVYAVEEFNNLLGKIGYNLF
jgi:hypothetical protein